MNIKFAFERLSYALVYFRAIINQELFIVFSLFINSIWFAERKMKPAVIDKK